MPHSSTIRTNDNGWPPAESEDKVTSSVKDGVGCRWRGLRWRVMLGVLPPCPAPIEELRRAAANGRRRYAELRRRLLVDPHIMEEIQKPNHLGMDNPLSQDPGSIWGRYFQNTELEKTIDKDLTRLYPEHESFFQSPVYQAMLRRILLVWSLIHPHYSYRQGMHELLAPLLYVLHTDVLIFSELKKRYEDLFDDRFDDPSMQGSSVYENERMRKTTSFFMHKALLVTEECRINSHDEWTEKIAPQDFSLLEPDEFGFDLRSMVLGSDTYGAEGDLGSLLSRRFIEHDAYCMFDALMSGQGGAIAMAEYFMTTSVTGSATGLSSVLEASAALYRALAAADVSLYLHLVGLGVEPQFFALRWLRVLFGREFAVENLLLLWDAIFAASNTLMVSEEQDNKAVGCRHSHRSAFISALAVSMLLSLRPALLASPDATSCLQKLLNFPQTVDIRSLINNAKVLQPLVEEAVKMIPSHLVKFARTFDQTKCGKLFSNGNVSPQFQGRNKLQQQASCSPEFLKYSLPESYWEEKWKNSVLQKIVPDEAGLQNRQKSSLEPHKKSASHDSADSIMCSAEGKDHQHLSVKGTVLGVHNDVNKAVRRKILCGTGEDDKIKCHSPDWPANTSPCPSKPSLEEQSPGDVKARDGEDNANEHVTPLDNKGMVSAEGLVARPADKGDINLLQEENDFTSGCTFSNCPFLREGLSVECDDQSSTSSVTSEDGGGSMETLLPFQKLKSTATGSHTGRFFWLWNRWRKQSGDKICAQSKARALNSEGTTLANASNVLSNCSAEDTSKASPEAQLQNDTSDMFVPTASNASNEVVQELRMADENQATLAEAVITRGLSELILEGSDVSPMRSDRALDAVIQTDTKKGLKELILSSSDVSLISKERGLSTVLQILGQSMLDNIQVVESALSQRTSVSSKECLTKSTAVAKEKSEHISKSLFCRKSHAAALTAVAELRKISNILLQM